MIYTIKQFAKRFNTTEHTLRYYTDIGILPCKRDNSNHRYFDEESVNWMIGITCLKGCGATIEVIKEYCKLCIQEEKIENLKARYQIILKQRDEAYKRLEEAKATVNYMNNKVKHYEDILKGAIPDDSNPQTWSTNFRPQEH